MSETEVQKDTPETTESSGGLPVEQVDALLAENDPNFKASMDELSSVVVPEGVNLDHDELTDIEGLDDSAESLSDEDRASVRERLRRLKHAVVYWSRQPKYWYAEFRQGALPFLKKVAGLLLQAIKGSVIPAIKSALGALSKNLSAFGDFMRYAPRTKKLLLLLAVILVGAASVPAWMAIKKKSLIFWKTEEFFAFDSVASEVWDVTPEEARHDFYSSSISPQFYILLEKMVINLAPSPGSPLPMGAFQIYLEGSTQEAAVEIRDREKEVRYMVQGALRQVTFDEMQTAQGVAQVKANIAGAINKILTQGRVRRVFFDTMVLKP